MSKLKRLINQLSDKDLKIIINNLESSEAFKSAELLKLFREGESTDNEIKKILNVNNNAFYTLRSRLNEKIENHFLEQSDSPRTVLLQQVAAINEIVLTKNKTIAIATLKKLEKELIHYDLSNELTLVYKALKKLTLHSPNSFEYSQLYNKHVAYMLAQDKVEDMVVDYFKRLSTALFEYETIRVPEFELIVNQIQQNSKLYHSHRLYVYHACVLIFHKLMVEKVDLNNSTIIDELDEQFKQVEEYIETYRMDITYHSMKWVFKYLALVYSFKRKDFNRVDLLLEELIPTSNLLLTNYGVFTCPEYFLTIILERYKQLGSDRKLLSYANKYLKTIDNDENNYISIIAQVNFRVISYLQNNKIKEGIHYINDSLDSLPTKVFPTAILDIKMILAALYYLQNNSKKAQFVINNVQRQIRLMGKENCEHTYLFMKVLKSMLTDLVKSKKEKKIATYSKKFDEITKPTFSPLRMISSSIFVNAETSVHV